jgi:uncharacterized membrane protein YczE
MRISVLVHRLSRLFAGLILFGVSLTLLVGARLGLDPWDVLHQGLSRRLHIALGSVVVLVSCVVLLLWIPLRQRPGFGTFANAVVVGSVVDLTLPVMPRLDGWQAQTGCLLAGVLLSAVATGLYLGADLGPGPRDGLMTSLASRGASIRTVRTAIGPLAHFFIPRLAFPPPRPGPAPLPGPCAQQ